MSLVSLLFLWRQVSKLDTACQVNRFDKPALLRTVCDWDVLEEQLSAKVERLLFQACVLREVAVPMNAEVADSLHPASTQTPH